MGSKKFIPKKFYTKSWNFKYPILWSIKSDQSYTILAFFDAEMDRYFKICTNKHCNGQMDIVIWEKDVY